MALNIRKVDRLPSEHNLFWKGKWYRTFVGHAVGRLGSLKDAGCVNKSCLVLSVADRKVVLEQNAYYSMESHFHFRKEQRGWVSRTWIRYLCRQGQNI